MSDTKVVAKTPMQLLKRDHKIVKELFSEYEKVGDGDLDEKDRLWRQINEELTIHAEIEERLFYPAIREVRTDEAEDLVNEAIEEHRIVKTLLEEMSNAEVGDDVFDAKMKVLRENVLHHAAEEEKEMFPQANNLPKDVLDSLVIEMETMKDDLEDKDIE
ncbi:MAG TPA: hemerythrin domain-containing protein [Planctomycetota bacterium]|jgi:hemerythrin superfamily protein|nr:hemerythrin domain-containing protein [Planctomycetota bacterium]